MMKVATLTFNPFQENTYVVSDATGQCVIIDAGNYGPKEDTRLSEFIDKNELSPVMAINTHGHIDHILGIEFVKKEYNIPFAADGEDKFLIDSAQKQGQIYGFTIEQIPTIDIDLKDMEQIVFGDTTLKIIRTPGHTPGHICLYNEAEKVLFTGDTLFRESIGRTDLPGGDYSWIMRSILENVMPLGSDVTFYPGHGAQSTLGHESLYNPFITEVLGGEVNY